MANEAREEVAWGLVEALTVASQELAKANRELTREARELRNAEEANRSMVTLGRAVRRACNSECAPYLPDATVAALWNALKAANIEMDEYM